MIQGEEGGGRSPFHACSMTAAPSTDVSIAAWRVGASSQRHHRWNHSALALSSSQQPLACECDTSLSHADPAQICASFAKTSNVPSAFYHLAAPCRSWWAVPCLRLLLAPQRAPVRASKQSKDHENCCQQALESPQEPVGARSSPLEGATLTPAPGSRRGALPLNALKGYTRTDCLSHMGRGSCSR